MLIEVDCKKKKKKQEVNSFTIAQPKSTREEKKKSTKTRYNITGWLQLLLVGSHVRGRNKQLRGGVCWGAGGGVYRPASVGGGVGS